MDNKVADLRSVDPDDISANPENPRLIFRENELNQLLESIREVGIQVPLTVFRDDGTFVLIDGERRLRCARKLNLAEVPVIIQRKPGKLENLLMMFNIHNVRQDWDLMPMALKLAEVRRMLEEQDKPAKPADLAGITGLTQPTVRRALELLELPQEYQDMLLEEAKKPKDQQRITADFFVEVNKSKRVVHNYVPAVFDNVSEEDYVEAMLDKYEHRVVNNVVSFRDISKIARAELAGEDPERVAPVLVRLVEERDYSIEDAYADTVRFAYETRDISTRTAGLRERLRSFSPGRKLPDEVRKDLQTLREEIDRLLGAQ